jgi:uncharacterized protein (DUF58 family)
MDAQGEISYRLRTPPSGVRVGGHRGRGGAGGGMFRDQVPFLHDPDARRIDVRATLRDPFEGTFVRRSEPRLSISLFLIVDLSASLTGGDASRKRDTIRSLCGGLARAATKMGDRFGLIGCGPTPNPNCFLPSSRRRGIGGEIDAAFKGAFGATGAEGLTRAHEFVGPSRKMVFLISDFHLPLDLIRQTFQRLAHHDVVPVVIEDSSEREDLPEFGIMQLTDLETRRNRFVAMTPALKQRWISAAKARDAEVRRIAEQYGRTPIRIVDRFDADAFSRSLLEG